MQSDGRPAHLPTGEIDLGALGRALWRRKMLIVGLTLVAAAIAFAAVNLITPRYKSESRVLIETRENIFLRPDAEKTIERGTTVDQEAVTSQVQLILSRDLAREVIKKLKLGERPEFDPVLAGPSLRTVLSLFGIIKDPMSMTPEERVFKSYYERLSVFQVEKSRVIAIEFESQDPELAARVANAVAEGYLVLQQAAKQEQTRAAGAWLSGEIDRLRAKVAEAEAKVEQYRSRTNLFIGNNNTSLSNQQLGDYNGQLASARAQKADAESKARLIRDALKAGTPIEFSDITNSELMRRLSEQRVTLRAQLAEQSSTLLDQHPRIKELRAQMADLDRQLRGSRPARALARERRQAGRRQSGSAQFRSRPAQATGGVDQRAGRAAARARARRQVAARPAGILPGQVPRGDRARQHRRGLARCPHHLRGGRLEHAVVAEEAADHTGRGTRHVRALVRIHPDQRIAQRAADASDAGACRAAPTPCPRSPAAGIRPPCAPSRKHARQRACRPTPSRAARELGGRGEGASGSRWSVRYET